MGLDFDWLADPVYRSWLLLGLETTILIGALSTVFAFLIGVAGAAVLHFRLPVLDVLVTVLVELFRNTPPLVQLFLLYFTVPEFGLHLTTSGGQTIPLFSGFVCVVISLALYNGALAVEIIRSGFAAVPHETIEGARALGYTKFQIFRHVELPMSFRLTIPASTINVVSIIKSSSQAVLVAVADIMYYANRIMLDTFRNLEVMIVVWALYVAICTVVTFAISRVAAATRIPGFGA